MIKICKRCSTENEDKYLYCKNCGAPLEENQNTSSKSEYQAPPSSQNFIPDDIDGIPTGEVITFIKSNDRKIIEKFAKMSITGSKISWCWPAAILSFLFGFFGAAIWLFYRKMYKYGLIALLIALLVAGLNTAITYPAVTAMIEQTLNASYQIAAEGNLADYLDAISDISNKYSATQRVIASNFIEEISNYAATIIYGIFGMFLYKKHAIAKITEYRTNNITSDYYNYGLSSIGGTSFGMAVLCALIYSVASNTLICISLFSSIFI